jgi:hypothetical protein
MTLTERACLLLVAEEGLAAAKRTRDAVAAELLAEVEDEIATASLDLDAGREVRARRLAIPGALISYVEAGTCTSLQQKACIAKLEALGARLRDLEIRDVDDAAPYTSSPRAAYLKVTPRL